MKNYSQSITRQRYCLNGIWDFACGKDGLDVLPTEYESVGIKVPSPYNVNGFMPSYYRNFCGEKASKLTRRWTVSRYVYPALSRQGFCEVEI